MMSKNFLRNELLKVAVFSILVATIHYFLLWKVLPAEYSLARPWRIHVFLLALTIPGVIYIVLQFKKDHTSVIKSFMTYTMIKIVGSIIFLAILLFYLKETGYPIVYQFVALFFPYLFVETRLFVRMLTYSPTKIEKN